MDRRMLAALWVVFLAAPAAADITADINPLIRTSPPGESVDYTITVTNNGPGNVTLEFETVGLEEHFSVAIVYTGGSVQSGETTKAKILATANVGVPPGLYTLNAVVKPSAGSPVTRQFMYNVTAVMLPDCDLLDGWNDTGASQWVAGGICTEKERLQREYRDYTLNATTGDCDYTVTQTQWFDSGATQPVPNGTDKYSQCPSAPCEADDCDGAGQCTTLPGLEAGAACSDGCDNDADGCTDGADVDCGGTEAGLCNDGADNNCDGEKDWDTLGIRGPEHGDVSCPVEVTMISLSSGIACPGETVDVTCTASVADVNSVFAYMDENSNGMWDAGDSDCGWNMGSGWAGSQATFRDCNVGGLGGKQVGCSVYSPGSGQYDRSYQQGTDRLTALTVGGATCCGIYPTQAACGGDAACEWCAECSGVKWSGGADRCVAKGACVYNCGAGRCGAACSGATPCGSYCNGSTSHHSGWCDLGSTCTCTYNATYCPSLDGYYLVGYAWDSGICSTCLECNTSVERNRDYFCNATTGLCDYYFGGGWHGSYAGGTRPIPDGEDPQDRCNESWPLSCSSNCVRAEYDGYCDGAGNCRTVDYDCPSGTVCLGSGNCVVPPTTGDACDERWICDPEEGPKKECGRILQYYVCNGWGGCSVLWASGAYEFDADSYCDTNDNNWHDCGAGDCCTTMGICCI